MQFCAASSSPLPQTYHPGPLDVVASDDQHSLPYETLHFILISTLSCFIPATCRSNCVLNIFHLGVDLKKASKALAQRFATGASVSKLPGGGEEIVVQGDVAEEVLELIEEAGEGMSQLSGVAMMLTMRVGGGNKAGAVFKDVPADACEIIEEKKKKGAGAE